MSRHLAALLVAAAALAAFAAPAAAADLAGQNTVVADATSYTEVKLTRPVVVDHTGDTRFNKTFRIQGGGRYGGVMLRQLGVADDKAATVIASRFDPGFFCGQDCAQPAAALSVSSIAGSHDPTTGFSLPAGRYRLYALAGSAPVNVTLTFPELGGERTFRPETPHAARLQELPARNELMNTVNEVYAFGAEVTAKEPTVVLDASLLYYGAKAASAYYDCRYEGAPTHPLSFFPTCPAEQDQIVHSLLLLNNIVVPGPGALSTTGSIFIAPGSYGFGGSYTSAALIDSAGAVALAVPVGPPASDGVVPQPPAPGPTVVEGTQQSRYIAPPAAPQPGQQQVGGQPGAGKAVTAAPARLTLASRKLRARRGRVAIPLRCAGPAPCRGRVALGTAGRSVKVAAGRRATVSLALPSRTVRTLRARAATTLAVSLADANAGTARTHRVRVSR